MLWKLPRWKKGDVITAEKLNQLVEAIERATINVSQGMGIDVQQGLGGTALRVAFPPFGFLMYTSAGITARSSGIPGTGTATYQNYDPTNDITDTSISDTVLNWSATDIGSGKYLWAMKDGDGFLWAVNAEC